MYILYPPRSAVPVRGQAADRRTGRSEFKFRGRAVQDYDLYLIRYDYFELLRLYYDSPHILSSLITVEYNTI